MKLEILTAGDDPLRERMGGKGCALARLTSARFNVPPWIILPPPEIDGEVLRRCVPEDFDWPEEFRTRIEDHLKGIASGGDRFAVRSSAVEEDGPASSFAGQLESFLDVERGEVPGRVVQVWRSGLSGRVEAYRREQGIEGPPRPPAVVVQKMVPSEVAGVAFSADVVGGRWSVAVISAVKGLGEALVSGESDADTWRVNRGGVIEEWQAADGSEEPLLTGDQVKAVADLARACERFFGSPQDIEWAWAGGELFLLQSRPVTTLGRLVDPEGVLRIWDNSNIAESYGGVTTPLTFSFAHYIYKEVYQQFCRMMHVPARVVEDHRFLFYGMLGLIRGRVYYNLMSWYGALALLPGFRLNHRFMERMMGVKEGMPESVLRQFRDDRPGAKVKDGFRFAWALAGLVKAQLFLPRMVRKFYAEFEEALRVPVPLGEMRADELAGHFRHLETRLLSRWNAPLVNDFFAMVYFGVLQGITKKWCGDEDATLPNGLLCGTGKIISAEPARRIHEMAVVARSREDFVATLLEAEAPVIESSMEDFAEFAALYQSYLDRFADRCLNELKLESPTLRDDPLPLFRTIGGLARRIGSGNSVDRNPEARLRKEAESETADRLKGRFLRKWMFRFVLKQARRRVGARENLRFERTRLFGRIRSIFVELGKRLAAVDVLDSRRDVFYLEIEEVLGFVEGTATTTDLKGLVRLRKNEFDRFAKEAPPADRFETRGWVNVGNPFRSNSTQAGAAPVEGSLKGIGCCPGVVRGKARVIRNPDKAAIGGGEILVAEQTDPGWIMLFPGASGVLVERGSLLSHSAIVSRELGIPAIVSVRGLLSSIETGDEIEMDGSTGVVRIMGKNDG
ncbi:MAG: PEP/pyruvate-binding domain-containing protein [Puniceicoccaceae bacterium]